MTIKTMLKNDEVSFNQLLQTLRLEEQWVGHAPKSCTSKENKWYKIKESHFKRHIIAVICVQIFGHLK